MEIRSLNLSAGQVGNYILDLADKDNRPVTPLKLQKLVYITFGWALVLEEIKLFEENIEAWEHGPVIPSLFHQFKVYRNNPIKGRSFNGWHQDGSVIFDLKPKDKKARKVIKGTWSAYGKRTAGQLRRLTHAPGTPWSQVYEEGSRYQHIEFDSIKVHYLELRRKYLGR